MTIGTDKTRVGQATEPGALFDDAALLQQADRGNQRTSGFDAETGRRDQRRAAPSAEAGQPRCTTVAVLLSLPFLYLVMMSLKPFDELGKTSWLPENPEFRHIGTIGAMELPFTDAQLGPFDLPFDLPIPANFVNVFDTENPDINNRGVPLHVYFRNSIFVACWVTFLQVTTSAMAAFSFARLKWTGRDKVFLLYLSTMMLPGLVMMIPNYQIMIELGLVDTLPGLIVPAAFSAFGTFLLRQFMLTIPSSLDEAAEIDGAGKWRLFWDIILPLSRPGLVTLTIFTFMGNYNSFFWPLVMLRTEERYTLPIGLLFFNSSRGQQTHLMMAAVLLSIIPMILIFVLLQKQLVKGIQLGAVKG